MHPLKVKFLFNKILCHFVRAKSIWMKNTFFSLMLSPPPSPFHPSIPKRKLIIDHCGIRFARTANKRIQWSKRLFEQRFLLNKKTGK